MSTLARAIEAMIERKVDERLRELAPYIAPRVYTQRDRPAWASTPLAFLRAHRALRRVGHPGATCVGRTRIMTEAASAAWLRMRTEGAPETVAANDESELLRSLGATKAGGQ